MLRPLQVEMAGKEDEPYTHIFDNDISELFTAEWMQYRSWCWRRYPEFGPCYFSRSPLILFHQAFRIHHFHVVPGTPVISFSLKNRRASPSWTRLSMLIEHDN
jgi:hypothetical protein